MATTEFTLDSSAYTQINTGAYRCEVQVLSGNACVIVADSAPAVTDTCQYQDPKNLIKVYDLDTNLYMKANVGTVDIRVTEMAIPSGGGGGGGGGATTDFHHEVARGNIAGAEQIRMTINSGYLNSGDPDEIPWWSSNGDVTVRTTDGVWNILYTNTLDGSTSTGALTLRCVQMKADYSIEEFTHTLGSSGTDVTTETGIMLLSVEVASTGGDQWNGGNIQIYDASWQQSHTINQYGVVAPQVFYGVAAGHTAVFDYASFGVSFLTSTADVEVKIILEVHDCATGIRTPVHHSAVRRGGSSTVPESLGQLTLTGGQILIVTCDANSTGTNAILTGNLSGVLYTS